MNGMPRGPFAEMPFTLNEAKAAKSQNAADWQPRDVLVSLLRAIDAGEIDMTAVVVCYRATDEDGKQDGFFRVASPDLGTSMGMIELAKAMMFESRGLKP